MNVGRSSADPQAAADPSLAEALARALIERGPDAKCTQVAALRWGGRVPAAMVLPEGIPGRPQRPPLVHPRAVPERGLGTPQGRAALCHAVAHIEFNAINLALDACLRFPGMPADYYGDWLSVAQDEARHFSAMRARLRALGYDYGDFEAHDGLWAAAEKTAQDVLLRMALVPRVLEARGLDVTPGMIRRLRALRDEATVAVLEVILAEEVRHVAIGTRWFRWLCAQRGLEPDASFERLLREHGQRLRGPLNLPARSAAGFSVRELALAGAI